MRRACAILAMLACAAAAQAQNEYPARPLRIVVPSAPGGGTDIVNSKSPEEFGQFLRVQTEFWAKIVKQAGAAAE